jgi:uncharacterized protein (DUF433 family)
MSRVPRYSKANNQPHHTRHGNALSARAGVEEVPGVNGGYPVVRGSSVPVRIIVEMLHKTQSLDAVLDMYPHLGQERIEAALAYYATHPDRVDEDIERNARAWAAHQAQPWPA